MAENGLPYQGASWHLWRDHRVFVPFAPIQNWVEAAGEKKVEPTQTIVPGQEGAYYSLTVPTEAARAAGNEILDFSGLFQALGGAGLSMEVTESRLPRAPS
ncbi:MAG TPA: hypothetical protein VKA46_08035 [Gemmataceae bacterium]|nr:hypothetical protein [Gemmataceae bacterium]